MSEEKREHTEDQPLVPSTRTAMGSIATESTPEYRDLMGRRIDEVKRLLSKCEALQMLFADSSRSLDAIPHTTLATFYKTMSETFSVLISQMRENQKALDTYTVEDPLDAITFTPDALLEQSIPRMNGYLHTLTGLVEHYLSLLEKGDTDKLLHDTKIQIGWNKFMHSFFEDNVSSCGKCSLPKSKCGCAVL